MIVAAAPSQPAPTSEKTPGEWIGRNKLLPEPGEGGSGVV
jgi:hypothetical protein